MATGERAGSIWEGGTMLGLGPAELLDRFTTARDEAAFAALVTHHGPMVLATCRRILPEHADADDAFQATFLVLARKAGSISDPDRLAPWLHGVARRVSVRARTLAARRQAVEGERTRPDEDEPAAAAVLPPPADAFELRSILDEELSRLPAKYRDPLVLCYLEGLTHDEAAGQLNWPVGTVRSRLAGGRDRLRGRLARRGLGPDDSLPVLVSTPAPAALAWAAVRVASGVGVVPARVLFLARGVSLAMTLLNPLKLMAVVGLVVGLATAGAAVALHRRGKAGPPPPPMARAPAPPRPAAPPPAPAPAPTPISAPIPETSPLTVSGRALDTQGKPIAGARIYLASCSSDTNRRLAETQTDAAGSYRFQDVPLPIRPDSFVDPVRRVQGVFQVFGRADGFGFAWVRAQRVRFAPVDLPSNTTLNRADFLKPGEPAVIDLAFPPPAPLSGRVTDDQGQPLAAARVWISSCGKPRLDRPFLVDEIDVFRAEGSVPPELNRRVTDADGRFTFADLPPGHWFELDIGPQGFPTQRIAATMTTLPDEWAGQQWSGRDVLTGPVDVVFPTPREIAVRLVAADTGRPLEQASFATAGALGLTDADGRCRLLVGPGEATYSALPRFTTPYLETRGDLVIPAAGPIAPIEIALRAACILEVTVTDAVTGQPIADVDLWEDGMTPSNPIPGRKPLAIRSFEAPRLVHSDRARTDALGKLRTFAEPGPRRVGVGYVPRADGRVAVEPAGQAINGQPGATLPLRFTMRGP